MPISSKNKNNSFKTKISKRRKSIYNKFQRGGNENIKHGKECNINNGDERIIVVKETFKNKKLERHPGRYKALICKKSKKRPFSKKIKLSSHLPLAKQKTCYDTTCYHFPNAYEKFKYRNKISSLIQSKEINNNNEIHKQMEEAERKMSENMKNVQREQNEREEQIRKNMEEALEEQKKINRRNLRFRLNRATNRPKTPQQQTNILTTTSFSNPVREPSQKEKNQIILNQSLENLKSYLGNLNLASIKKINKNTKEKLVNIILKIKTEQNTKQKNKLLKRFYQSLKGKLSEQEIENLKNNATKKAITKKKPVFNNQQPLPPFPPIKQNNNEPLPPFPPIKKNNNESLPTFPPEEPIPLPPKEIAADKLGKPVKEINKISIGKISGYTTRNKNKKVYIPNKNKVVSFNEFTKMK